MWHPEPTPEADLKFEISDLKDRRLSEGECGAGRAFGAVEGMVTVDLTVEAPAREWGETWCGLGGGGHRRSRVEREAMRGRIGWGLIVMLAM